MSVTLTENAKVLKSSQTLFDQAQHYMPGGVNSPVRAFQAVGGIPPFIQQAKGAYLVDCDNNQYIDYVGAWGPMILGHGYPEVLQAVQDAIQSGMSFGAPCAPEVKLAETICTLMPSVQKIRMTNSGTEATMTAIRLARGFTGKSKIIKFIGCYHGHADCLLVEAGSGALTLSVPSSPGVPNGVVADTLTASFNDLSSVIQLFEQHGSDIAAIIVEPICGNMNMILPDVSFLAGLREISDQYKALLIFDEVMTGFRVALGGAQSLYGVTPDLTTLGKIIGGGMPVGAVGGKDNIMSLLSPEGSVYQAGTLSGNPIAMTAGLATLKALQTPGFYTRLGEVTSQLVEGLLNVAKNYQIPLTGCYQGGMFGLCFSHEKHISRYDQVVRCNQDHFKQFFHGMLARGIYFAPSAFEAGFVSSAHSQEDITKTVHAAELVFSGF